MVQGKQGLKQVLYLSYDGMTDPLGQGQVLSYLQGLSKEGYAITLISFEKPARYTTGKTPIEVICNSAGISWHPLIYTKKPPVFSTLYDFQRMWNTARKLHVLKNFTIVHCRSYISALAGLKMKKKFGTPFIFDMRGFWVDEKIETGEWNPRKSIYKLVIKFLRRKENLFYQKADTIITLTQAARQVIIEKIPAIQNKIKVIPTCVNLDLFKPFKAEMRNAVRKKMGIPEKAFVLLYSGGYGANYDIDFLLHLFNELKKKDPETCLLILSKDGITGLTPQTDTKNIFTASLSYVQVGNFLMAGDLGVINYVNRFSVAGRSPTKLGEYWACGLPAVAPGGIGDVDTLFKTYRNGGIIYNKEDFYIRLKEVMAIEKNILRNYADEYFSLEKGVGLYKTVYESYS